MIGELINGAYHVLGELRGSTRPGLWLAHSLVTGELVTLAVPAPGGDPPTADGLRREGEIFGEITNRHVQAVVDWSCDDVLVVWAYLPAWTLATALRAAPPPSVGAVMRLMLEVSQGLSAVHSRGAVYCGLHPGRILVQRDGTASLATTPEAVLAKRGRLVATGPPPETPVRYLAPEQIEGAAGGRSDLYSLAAVAYELLTGHKIYTNPDSVTLAVEISKTTPPPPSTYRPDLPPEVDDLFAYCLARKPQDRPGSVAALVPYLNKLLSSVAGPETESLAFRLGLHPVAYPLLASDTDRAALFSAVSVPTGGQPQQADAAMAEEAGAGEIARAADGSDGDGNGPAGRRELLDGRRHAGSAPRSFSSDPAFWPAYLVASDGRTYPLETADATVGRRGTNGVAPDIDLRDLDLGMVVSREHAALRFHDGVWHVIGLKARNGTWLNDQRLTPGSEMPLSPGDRLRLASLELVFRGDPHRRQDEDEDRPMDVTDEPPWASDETGQLEALPQADDVRAPPRPTIDVSDGEERGMP